MRMLENLKNKLDDIELDNDNAYHFLSRLIEQDEEGRRPKLSRKQFSWLSDLHDRYC